jgi:hypothetical protein
MTNATTAVKQTANGLVFDGRDGRTYRTIFDASFGAWCVDVHFCGRWMRNVIVVPKSEAK